MCNEFLSWLLQASLKASVIILIVLLLRWLFKDRINAKWYVIMWTIVALRLILPWAPNTRTSMFNIIDINSSDIQGVLVYIENYTESKHPTVESDEVGNKSFVYPGECQKQDSGIKDLSERYAEKESVLKSRNIIGDVDESENGTGAVQNSVSYISGYDISYKPHTAPLVFWSLIIWIGGVLTFYSYIIISNIKFYKKTNDRRLIIDTRIWRIAKQCKKQLRIKKSILLYETGAVEEPCIYGLVNPVILLPKNMMNTLSDVEVRCVLTHELIHYKKKDNILNLLIMIISGMHWFNPLVHTAFLAMKHDNELLCDYITLKHMSGERYTYGKTLLKLACSSAQNKLVILESIIGSKKGLKQRITRIAKNKGYGAFWSLIAVLMIIVVGCTGLSNEQKLTETEKFANLEPVKLNLYTRGYGDKLPEVEDILKEIEQRLSDTLRITPVFHWIPSENYMDEIKRLISSGEDIDAYDVTSIMGNKRCWIF